MKISELKVGAKQGSQKKANHPTATDDTKKYMGTGEWEAYREPQGIGSKAGKKVTKGSSVVSSKGRKDESVYSDKSKFKARWKPSMLPDPNDAPAPAPYASPPPGMDGIRYVLDLGVRDDMKNKAHASDRRRKRQLKNRGNIKEGVQLSEEARAMFSEDFTVPNPTSAYWFWANPQLDTQFEIPAGSSHTWEAIKPEGPIKVDPKSIGFNSPEEVPQDSNDVLLAAMENGWVRGGYLGDGHIVLQAQDVEVALDALNAFKKGGTPLERAELGGMVDGTMLNLDASQMKTFLGELDGNATPVQGGPGVSNDLRAVDRDVLTMADLEDQEDKEIGNAEAPAALAMSKVRKLNTDTPGLRESRLDETVPRSRMPRLNAEYELRDDRDTQTIGVAKVVDGVIESLAFQDNFNEDFNGHIMSRLLGAIVADADLANANLAIQIEDPNDNQKKRFLERFGFRQTQDGIMKRNAGSIRPTSVPTARL